MMSLLLTNYKSRLGHFVDEFIAHALWLRGKASVCSAQATAALRNIQNQVRSLLYVSR